MVEARKEYLERIRAFHSATQSPALLPGLPLEFEHNNTARLLRNGLAVVGYGILEDYIRRRTAEILSRIGGGITPFDELPEKLKEAAVTGALRAILFVGDIKRRSGEDYLTFLQQEALLVASTSNNSYQISGFSLGCDKSNLTAEDVQTILQAFKIKDPWGNIGALSGRIGLSAPSHKDLFAQAAKRRHLAAHDANADTNLIDLQNFVNHAMAVAITFDALISKSLRMLLDRNPDYKLDNFHLQASMIKLRFLDQGQDACWREYMESGGRALHKHRQLSILLQKCLSTQQARKDVIVVRNASRQPSEWHIPAVA